MSARTMDKPLRIIDSTTDTRNATSREQRDESPASAVSLEGDLSSRAHGSARSDPGM